MLYHSNLSFSERLYGPLDVDLCRVKLHEPLAQIVQQPLLYVRDMVPKPCFEALTKLYEVFTVNYCEIYFIRWIFNFVFFMGRAIHEFKIPTKYLFTFVILCII